MSKRLVAYSFDSPGHSLIRVLPKSEQYEKRLQHCREVKTDVMTDAEARRPKFRCVPMDMEAVFLNLLTNAVWATRNREHRQVQVEFSFDASNYQILFSDNGVGIPPEKNEKVFLPFFTSKGPTGIGLGLTIVPDTVRKYGGDVTVITPPKTGGATFQITLPRGSK